MRYDCILCGKEAEYGGVFIPGRPVFFPDGSIGQYCLYSLCNKCFSDPRRNERVEFIILNEAEETAGSA